MVKTQVMIMWTFKKRLAFLYTFKLCCACFRDSIDTLYTGTNSKCSIQCL